MNRVVIISLMCLLSFFQYSWGYQTQAQESSPGLVDVLADIVTAPCTLLATCLGIDGGDPCTCPQKQRLNCVPVKKPCRPARPGRTITKVPSGTKPPGAQVPTPTPGVSERPPGLTPQIQRPPAPSITTRKEAPPQREAAPGAPTARPILPGILPGPSEEPMPVPGPSKQSTPSEQRRTTVPQEPSLNKTPGRVPVPPPPGVSKTPGTSPVAPRLEIRKTPPVPRTEKTGKPSKPGQSRQWAPHVPVSPPAPCTPVPSPAQCGPQLFFR